MILVTGATGFLGNVLVDRLFSRGAKQVACLVRKGGPADAAGARQDKLTALSAAHPGASVELRATGLESPDDVLPALEGVTLIYHLAAAMTGSPADMYMSTVVATKNLFEAIARRKAAGHAAPRVVVVSSLGVYGVAQLPRGAMVDERTPLEARPERRDVYSQTKLRQEQLCRDYEAKLGLSVVFARPGVIYGPGGGGLSSRIGLQVSKVFLSMGGNNALPLTYVDNCADAILAIGENGVAGEAYNVIDDELPTCRAYLAMYRQKVRKMPVVPVPYVAAQVLSRASAWYAKRSKGQLPAVLTPYRTAATWGGNRFDNGKLKALGWKPLVRTAEGIARTMEDLRARAKK